MGSFCPRPRPRKEAVRQVGQNSGQPGLASPGAAAPAADPDPGKPAGLQLKAGRVRPRGFFSLDAIPGAPSSPCLSPALTGQDWSNSGARSLAGPGGMVVAHALPGAALGARRQWPARPGPRIGAAHTGGGRETENKGTADTRIRGARHVLEAVKAGRGAALENGRAGVWKGRSRSDRVTTERALRGAGRGG